MKTALISGATGLIGSRLTKLLLDKNVYDKVVVLVRTPMNLDHPQLEQVFFDYDKPDFSKIQADHIYCCLGTTIRKAGSKENFRKVDHDYPLMLAKAGLENGAVKFALVSAMGADKNATVFYNRVKGEVEEDIKRLDYPALLIFRPSLLLGKREEFRLGEEIGKVIMKAFSFLIPAQYKPIEAEKVAASMAKLMQEESGEKIRIVDSKEMRGDK